VCEALSYYSSSTLKGIMQQERQSCIPTTTVFEFQQRIPTLAQQAQQAHATIPTTNSNTGATRIPTTNSNNDSLEFQQRLPTTTRT